MVYSCNFWENTWKKWITISRKLSFSSLKEWDALERILENSGIGSIKFLWFMGKYFLDLFFLKLDIWTDGHHEHFQLHMFMCLLVLVEIPKVFWKVLQSSSGSSIGKRYFLIFFYFSVKRLFCFHQPLHAISV